MGGEFGCGKGSPEHACLARTTLLRMSQNALRAVASDRGRPQVFVRQHFPASNVVRLWRLTGGFLKKYLEHLARNARNRRFMCWFQVQELDGPELWRPRGAEVPAGDRRPNWPGAHYTGWQSWWRVEPATVCGTVPVSYLGRSPPVEQWEVCGYLFGRRIFALVQKHSIVPIPETPPQSGCSWPIGTCLPSDGHTDAQPVSVELRLRPIEGRFSVSFFGSRDTDLRSLVAKNAPPVNACCSKKRRRKIVARKQHRRKVMPSKKKNTGEKLLQESNTGGKLLEESNTGGKLCADL